MFSAYAPSMKDTINQAKQVLNSIEQIPAQQRDFGRFFFWGGGGGGGRIFCVTRVTKHVTLCIIYHNYDST